MAPGTVSTRYPARGPMAIRYVQAAACSGLSVRASSESPSLSAMWVQPSSSTNTPCNASPVGSAFTVTCPHKLVHPTPALSFIGVRKGLGSEPAQVIHRCGDDSRCNPDQRGRVLAGPAPQPLAKVLLERDAASDRLHAVGLRGGEMFKAFFEKYAFKLEMELCSALALVGATRVCKPARAHSRQWQSCHA